MGYTLLSIDPGFTSFGYTISRIELGGHMILQRLGVEHPTAEADRAEQNHPPQPQRAGDRRVSGRAEYDPREL